MPRGNVFQTRLTQESEDKRVANVEVLGKGLDVVTTDGTVTVEWLSDLEGGSPFDRFTDDAKLLLDLEKKMKEVAESLGFKMSIHFNLSYRVAGPVNMFNKD